MSVLEPPPFPPPVWEINRARARFDADAYAEMVALVARAEQSVRMEFFLFGGPVADTIIDLLIAKIAAGVRVRVTLDRMRGSLPFVRHECRKAHRRLIAGGVDVLLSDPRPFPHSPRRPAVTHNKFLVVDDREALVGGMNVGALFFRHHDVMIHLEGPAALALARQFDYDRSWITATTEARLRDHRGLPPVMVETPVPHQRLEHGESWARLLGTGVGRRTTETSVLASLRAAQSSVDISMSEIGRTESLGEVIAAHARGVNVRVLVDPQDLREYLPPLLGPLRAHFPKGVLNALAVRDLRAAGVAVRQFEVGQEFALLHQKTAIFDRGGAIVGSTNWTRGGFGWVGETDVELRGGAVIGELLAQFERDWERSTAAVPPSLTARIGCALYERI
ncbi:MAG: phosphatidylserine/phosphatidylglycerophosphate/cardiolipin synthase family protein [Cytophagales bacterium]|nr:phosphatidylserine/phosphatidylglycerophosphate/cardiolipin synthase family protein [Armatimonadota bacterium]